MCVHAQTYKGSGSYLRIGWRHSRGRIVDLQSEEPHISTEEEGNQLKKENAKDTNQRDTRSVRGLSRVELFLSWSNRFMVIL